MGVCGMTRGAVFLGNVLLSLLCLSESVQITLRRGTESSLCVSSQVPSCTLCTGNATSPDPCSQEFCAEAAEETTLQVICSVPLEEAFHANVSHTIECTKDSCSPATGVAQTSLLTQLPRTLSWGVETPSGTMVELTVVGEGLSESGRTGPCPDGPTYVVTQTGPSGRARRRTYCRGGSITSFTLQSGSLALLLRAGTSAPETVFSVSPMPLKGPTVSVTLDPDVTAEIRRSAGGGGGPKCEVCTGKGASCDPARVLLSKAQTTEVEFGCLLPQEIFNVQLQRTIACTDAGCVPAAGKVVPEQLADFQRTFLWDVSLPKRTVLTLDFPAPGLTETTAGGTCQDGHKYSVRTAGGGAGGPKEAAYCRGPGVTRLTFQGNTSLALEVPGGAEPGADVFSATAAPRPGRVVPVSAAPHTHLLLTRPGPEPACEACAGETCGAERLHLLDAGDTWVTFDCAAPQQLWKAEVNQEIDCTNPACHRQRVQAQSALFPDFNRTFTWDLKVKPDQTIQMDFPEPGLRQVARGDACPDGHTYSLVAYQRSGVVNIGTYCRGGTVAAVLVPYKVRLVLQVPGDRALDSRDFELSVAPETNALVTVKVDLPRGVSETSFMAAHYPGDFPTNQQMIWDIRVPGMHNYTVGFTDHRLPEECLAKRVELRYQGADGKVTRPGLGDPQPRHKQGDFNMSLTNCETNRTLGGLALAFTVSVMRSGHPVLCTVDLTKNAELSLQIEKVGSDPYCEMSVDSVVKDKVRVDAGTSAKLSFLDCPGEDLRLTASTVVGAAALRGSKSQLTVPRLEACLPMALSSFTWRLRVPGNRSLDLSSPSPGGLRQSLPGRECNGSGALRLTEGAGGGGGGHSIGTFCQQGLVEKVQVRADVSVTVETRGLLESRATPFLNVTVTDEISEHIIYTVKPQILSPALLATPSWPQGMKPSSTVSWLVLVPDNHLAVVKFTNVTQPTCDKWHTSIKVQPLGSKEEILSRREDEALEDLLVSESFFLNMSNCLPDKNHFSALTTVTLQPKSSPVGIILGVLGAILLLVLVFTVVAVLLRRKKSSKAANTASIYISKGNIFRTGDAHFAKARSDNASHVYDSIDETMVYGHLLRGSAYSEDLPDHFNGPQVDSYRTFLGPVDQGGPADADQAEPSAPAAPGGGGFQTFLDPADSFLPPRPRTPIAREESLGFQDRRMVDNELYTFKSTGGFNTIRLSGADQQEGYSYDDDDDDDVL